MSPALLLFFIATVQAEPVVLGAQAAIDLAVTNAPALQAALGRENAARLLARQARAWTNPTLSTAAENVGATREVTGVSGVSGLEGQMTLGLTLPLGGDRAAAIDRGSALERAASATTDITDGDVRAEIITAIALSERDATLAESAEEEAAALRRFAAAIRRRAEEGAASGGDAARASLERVIAGSNAARRVADLAMSQARLARLVGIPLGTPIRVTAPRCVGAWSAGAGRAPELSLAEAVTEATSAAGRMSRARRVPDLAPEVGFRRTGGFSSLFLGLSFELPIFTYHGDVVRAADAEMLAAEAERDGTALRLEAEVHGARASLSALDGAAREFTAQWVEDRDRAVRSAEARYEEGEGTLTALLDARRTRLAALDDFARLRAERRIARARLARLSGAALDASALCDDTLEAEP